MTETAVEVAMQVRPLAGHPRGGDVTFARHYDDGALIAVVDGLGHGLDAYFAARTAYQTLEQALSDQPDQLLALLHKRLEKTVGAVASIVRLYREHLLFAGVGNIRVQAGTQQLVAPGGTLGSRFREQKSQKHPLQAGQWVVMCSDGLSYHGSPLGSGSAETQVQRLMDEYAAGNDDTSVLVARWRQV